MKIAYQSKRFSPASAALIDCANRVIASFQAEGYDMTLRQLYYQLVKANLIANQPAEYKRLGEVISDGRLAGLVDWEAIVDRTRNLRALSHWSHPSEILRSAAYSYRLDKWRTQKTYVEVWIEKDALVGVLDSVCTKLDVPLFSCRGYSSQSEMWSAARRFKARVEAGQRVVIVHLGDHDPSGLDMTRDIAERITMFLGPVALKLFSIERIALNRSQVDAFDLPPNPAKLSDSRASSYVQRHGESSWELDALSPRTLSELAERAVRRHIDPVRWEAVVRREQTGRDRLIKTAARMAPKRREASDD